MERQNRTLLVLKYLWEETDIEHPVTIKDIIAYLEKNGVSSTRKTITGDIEDLQSFGVDIDCQRSTQNRYFIDVRTFELPELKLLVDAVQSSRFITTAKSKKLIKKLSGFVGKHQSKELQLPWILHLFVGLWYVFRICRLHSHFALFHKYPIQRCHRTSVAALAEFNPKHNQARMRVAAAHIPNELQLCLCVLIGVAVRSVGAVF